MVNFPRSGQTFNWLGEIVKVVAVAGDGDNRIATVELGAAGARWQTEWNVADWSEVNGQCFEIVSANEIAWSQARIGDVLEFQTRSYGKIRGIVRDVPEPGFPKPIDVSTNYGGFVLYRDTSPRLTVIARGATYPVLGDFSIFG